MDKLILWSLIRLVALVLIVVLYPDPVAKGVSVVFILHVLWSMVTE